MNERNALGEHPDSDFANSHVTQVHAPEGRYAWLSRFVFVGIAEKTPTGNSIAYFKVL